MVFAMNEPQEDERSERVAAFIACLETVFDGWDDDRAEENAEEDGDEQTTGA
jgi:hypothetical protein